ncbi:hypothetical protein GCM10011430_11540 [Oxalicibacterium solurbis]|uniref:Uncharacterized protein n=1 Tax=Oxalicibacterium solurbis TaxID=69280 RepID=A0A8J3AVF4_9BURK|nr:hypothetical protein GCM10011430_11540 [Oxalicibacterium solurbis]
MSGMQIWRRLHSACACAVRLRNGGAGKCECREAVLAADCCYLLNDADGRFVGNNNTSCRAMLLEVAVGGVYRL